MNAGGQGASRDVNFWLRAKPDPNNAAAFRTLAQQIAQSQDGVNKEIIKSQTAATSATNATLKNASATMQNHVAEFNRSVKSMESTFLTSQTRMQQSAALTGATMNGGGRGGGSAVIGGFRNGGGGGATSAASHGQGGIYADLARAALPDHYVRSVFRVQDAYSALSGSGALAGVQSGYNRLVGRSASQAAQEGAEGLAANAAQRAMLANFPGSMQVQALSNASGLSAWPASMQLGTVPAGMAAHAVATGQAGGATAGGAASMSVTIAAVAPVAAAALAAAAAAGLGASAINDIARGKAIGTGAGRYAQSTMGGVTSNYTDEDGVLQVKSNYSWMGRAIQFSGIGGMAFDATRSALLDTDERGVQAGERRKRAEAEGVNARDRIAQRRMGLRGLEFEALGIRADLAVAGNEFARRDLPGLATHSQGLLKQMETLREGRTDLMGVYGKFTPKETGDKERLDTLGKIESIMERQKANLAEQRDIAIEKGAIELRNAQTLIGMAEGTRDRIKGQRDAAEGVYNSGAAAFGGMNAGERMEVTRALERVKAGELPDARGQSLLRAVQGDGADKLNKLLVQKGEEFGYGDKIGAKDKQNLANFDQQWQKALQEAANKYMDAASKDVGMKAVADEMGSQIAQFKRESSEFILAELKKIRNDKGGNLQGVGK